MGFDLSSYEPVEDRIRAFWEEHPTGRIVTELLAQENADYIVQAFVYRGDEHGLSPAATGLAHDSYDQLPQNMKSSALETCETSAIGRALANLGYAPKGKRPSRTEMEASGGVQDATLPASSPPGPKSEPVVPEGAPAGSDTTPEVGTDSHGGKLAPASEHVHDWKPSPQKRMAEKGWQVCPCGAAEKKESV